jgi:N-acetylglucosaminyl-diphospho-decaprenol L-rhamnosyltransferase
VQDSAIANLDGTLNSRKSANTIVVAIVSYGRPADVIACLSALSRSSYTDFEVIIIENAGSVAFDRLTEALDSVFSITPAELSCSPHANVRLAGLACVQSRNYRLLGMQHILTIEANDNLGYGGGINLALRCLDGATDWQGIWILNPDTEPAPTALEMLVNHANAGGYGAVGCRLVLAGRDRIQMRGGRWCRLIARGISIGYGEPAEAPADVDTIERQLQWISGAALYATRTFVITVGPMSEQYFLYCEDVDWCMRRGRFTLGYAHNAVVNHMHGTTIGSAARMGARSDLSIYLSERNNLLLTRVHFPVLYPLVILVTFCLTFDYLIRGNRRVFAAAWRGWCAGLRGEIGRP